MGWGKGKDKDDDDPGRNMRRKPGESGEDLVRRLGRNVAEGRQNCPTCNRSGKVRRQRQAVDKKGKTSTVWVDERCPTCNGVGTVRGKTR